MNLLSKRSNNPQAITNPEMYVNTCPAPKVSTIEAKNPPMKLAIDEANIQTAIKIEANFGGDNFVTTDKPTGERQSSPIVCNK